MEPATTTSIEALLKEYTEDLPKEIHPSDKEKLLLLVEPKNFKSTILFSPGVSIFKAIYGRGKTYGIGYYTVHYCERTKECSAIYLNLRKVHDAIWREINSKAQNSRFQDVLSKIGSAGTIRLDLELLYAILSVIGPSPSRSFDKGDVLVTSDLKTKVDEKVIEDIRQDVMQVTDDQKLMRLFESLVENLVIKKRVSPKLILVLDEFEQIVPNWFNQTRVVGNLIQGLLESLRSSKGGVLEKYPNSFVLVLAIQELAYPSDVMKKFRESAAPIIGKMISAQDDLSIPIRFSLYTPESISEYYEKSLDLLATRGIITEGEKERLKLISDCVSRYFSPLLNMPARLFFERLRAAIANIVVMRNQVTGTVKDEEFTCAKLDKFFKDIMQRIAESGIYKFYMMRDITGISQEKILAMLTALAKQLENVDETNIVPERKRRGYEGVVVLPRDTKKGITILLYKGTNVKLGETKVLDSFKYVYEGYLKEYCSFPKGQKNEPCKIILVHPDNVNVIGMYKVLNEYNGTGNIRFQKKVINVPLDRDELAALYIMSPSRDGSDESTLLTGDMEYYKQRFNEVIEKIKMLIQRETT